MDALEERMNSLGENEQLEIVRLLIEQGAIVRPDNLPVEYNEIPLLECITMVAGKPERLMKPAEKAFIRSYIKSARNYVKQQLKEEKKRK